MTQRAALLALSLLLSTLSLQQSALGGGNEPPGDDSGKSKKGKPKEDTPNKEEAPSVCVKHTTQARFVSGYDHLVHLDNTCSKTARCDVSTDVNPKKQTVTLKSGAQETVLTFRGSPAREFRAQIECNFVD